MAEHARRACATCPRPIWAGEQCGACRGNGVPCSVTLQTKDPARRHLTGSSETDQLGPAVPVRSDHSGGSAPR